jgi:hypothetical protein
MRPVDAALTYAARGWPVHPVREKRPLTAHGLHDATTDADLVIACWRRWPDAEPSIATGAQSGIVALDIDIRENVNGLDSLNAMGVATHPVAPTSHTPSGGLHVLFRHPGYDVKTIAGRLGAGLDIRADRGSLTLPSGRPDRYWDPVLTIDTPLADMPGWMIIPEPQRPPPEPRQRPQVRLSAYCEAALDRAVKAICSAPAGQQRETLNREAFSVGRLAGGGAIAPALALESLVWAARRMPSFDARRPWRPVEVEKIVTASFSDGLRQPREIPHGR